MIDSCKAGVWSAYIITAPAAGASTVAAAAIDMEDKKKPAQEYVKRVDLPVGEGKTSKEAKDQCRALFVTRIEGLSAEEVR